MKVRWTRKLRAEYLKLRVCEVGFRRFAMFDTADWFRQMELLATLERSVVS